MNELNSTTQVVAILTGTALGGLVLWLIRKGRLREETGLYWLAAVGLLLFLALRRDLLEWTAAALGVAYAPSVLLLGTILAGILLALHFSVALARLSTQNKRLAQEVALLAQMVEQRGGEPSSHPPRDESGILVTQGPDDASGSR
jgi:hypothetical protein